MKKLISLLLITATLFAFSACQPTPKKPVVVSKGDGRLQEIINGSPAPKLTSPYEAPKEWAETLEGKTEQRLTVNIDAKIHVPSSLNYPVFKCNSNELSQDEALNFIKEFIGDNELYDYGDRTESDDYLKVLIEKCDYQLNDPKTALNTEFIGYKSEADSMYDFIKQSCETYRDSAYSRDIQKVYSDGNEFQL